MSTRTTTVLGRVRPVVDEKTIDRSNGGHQIDWPNVNVSYKQSDQLKLIPSFTIMGTALGLGKMSPRQASTNVATCILEGDAKEGDLAAALSGYGAIYGGYFYETLMPDATGSPRTLASALKTELGARFVFFSYVDTR